MKTQDISAKHIGFKVEPKAEERALMSCNTADIRSSALGITSNTAYSSDDEALDYLASILVEIFMHLQHGNVETGGNLLPSIDKGTG